MKIPTLDIARIPQYLEANRLAAKGLDKPVLGGCIGPYSLAALAKEPEILLLDEPLSNLDARLRLEMREEIRRLQLETGITTIFVTHDQEEALSISDHILLGLPIMIAEFLIGRHSQANTARAYQILAPLFLIILN